jgi:hypothetical protein
MTKSNELLMFVNVYRKFFIITDGSWGPLVPEGKKKMIPIVVFIISVGRSQTAKEYQH